MSQLIQFFVGDEGSQWQCTMSHYMGILVGINGDPYDSSCIDQMKIYLKFES